MASLALASAGSVIGGAIGGPWGARIGWAVGAAVGNRLTQQNQRVSGPRLNDRRIQASTWGEFIPLVYGRFRLAGNLIWTAGIREVVSTTRNRGKGGPTTTTTTYSYFSSFAVAICAGPIVGIRKIWANGQLIYNAGTDANVETLIESNAQAGFFTVYPGDETQMPSSVIEAVKGAGNVPAYRGLAYVVFDNLALAPYGNALPNLEFEVVTAGAIAQSAWTATAVPSPGVFTGIGSDGSRLVSLRAVLGIYTSDDQGGSWTFQTVPTGAVSLHSVNYGGGLWVAPDQTSGTFQAFTSPDGAAWTGRTLPSAGGWRYHAYGNGTHVIYASNKTTCATSANGISWSAQTCPNINPCTGLAFGNGIFVAVGSASQSAWSVDGVTWNAVSLPLAGVIGIVFGEGVFVAISLGPTNQYITSTDGIVWTSRALPTSQTWRTISYGLGTFVVLSDAISYFSANGLDGWTNATTAISRPWSGAAFAAPYVVAVHSGAQTDGQRFAVYNTISANNVPVADIATDLIEKADIDAADIDSSGVTDFVAGYAVTRLGTVRDHMGPLQEAFFFDAIESEYAIKLVKRGGAIAATIPLDDLGAYDYGSDPTDPVSIVRSQETDLPRRINVRYANADGDYLPAVEASQRIVTSSRQEVVNELPVAITPARAATIANVQMYNAYTARTAFTFSTAKTYTALEPADVVTIPAENGTYRVRITKKDESGPMIQFESVADDALVYFGTGAPATDQITQSQIVLPALSLAEYYDIPIVRDEDDNIGFYAQIVPVAPGANWRGATLYESADNVDFEEIGNVFQLGARGTCSTVLGDWTGGNINDETNSVTVVLSAGSLASVTFQQFLDGAFVALVGNELIFARVATLIATDTYQISGLLRGRFGTEQHIGTHAASERFVLMSPAGMLRPVGPASSIGAERFYKPISIGRRFDTATGVAFTNTAIGLMPYSGVNVRGGKQANDDFLIVWDRRSRVDAGWRSLVDIPIGEATEAYEVDILDGGDVVRTISASTPTVTYTDAMQVADFGSTQSSIDIAIYQISAIVGRGFPALATL